MKRTVGHNSGFVQTLDACTESVDTMDVPFHRVKVCGPVLVAARGASIHTFRVADGSYMATWSLPQQPGSKDQKKTPAVSTPEVTTAAEPSGTPPSKRRKVESAGDAKGQQPTAAEEARGPRKKRAPAAAVMAALRSGDLPVVSILEVTADGRHVVVVMGHDKTVRVLAHDGNGHLEQISERVVPKRPSAAVVTADGQTILCGDKFGDVYALPLVETAEAKAAREAERKKAEQEAQAKAQAKAQAQTATPLELRANSFTVHTKGNLQALEQQRRQKEQQTQQQRKQQPEDDGSCSLLLGHVSMLTAVAIAEAVPVGGQPATTNPRPLILTADRDEHIRVTRGVLGPSPPQTAQTHIIETFCLGHTAFVSRLCVAARRPDRLISGGGDGVLRVWDFWPDGHTVETVALGPLVEAVGVSAVAAAPDESMQKKGLLAVSGLYSFGEEAVSVLVAVCERVPALFFFALQADGNTLTHTQTLRLPGFPLDVVVVEAEDGPQLLVATAAEDESETEASLLAVTRNGQSPWTVTDGPWATLPAEIDAQDTNVDPTALRQQLLFSTESLRKTGDEGTE